MCGLAEDKVFECCDLIVGAEMEMSCPWKRLFYISSSPSVSVVCNVRRCAPSEAPQCSWEPCSSKLPRWRACGPPLCAPV